jgi:hypothetical protein
MRCDFDGYLVYLDKSFLFFLFFCIIPAHGFVSSSFVWRKLAEDGSILFVLEILLKYLNLNVFHL